MAMITMVRAIKKVHPTDLVLFKIGTFYQTYGKDSYIISYLFGYKTKRIQDNYSTCGFPASCLSKNLARLEENKINYVIVDKRNNYEDDEFSDNKNLNTYEEYFEKAHRFVTIKNRIDQITEYLIGEINKEDIKEKINKIEDVIYERRKV